MEIRRVLVGADGSANAGRAIEWAAGLASAIGAHVVAVHALGLLARDDDGGVVPAQSLRAEAADALEHLWCKPLAEAGVHYDCVVRDGASVSVLLDAARELDVDLIVVGSRGLGGYPELLLGSTSTQVAQRSNVPVVIVPAKAFDQTGA